MDGMRGTNFIAGRRWLRDQGLEARYLGALTVAVREAITGVGASAWLPMSVALPHYEALDALGLSFEQRVEFGASVSRNVNGVVLNTIARLAGTVGSLAVRSAFTRREALRAQLPWRRRRRLQDGADRGSVRGFRRPDGPFDLPSRQPARRAARRHAAVRRRGPRDGARRAAHGDLVRVPPSLVTCSPGRTSWSIERVGRVGIAAARATRDRPRPRPVVLVRVGQVRVRVRVDLASPFSHTCELAVSVKPARSPTMRRARSRWIALLTTMPRARKAEIAHAHAHLTDADEDVSPTTEDEDDHEGEEALRELTASDFRSLSGDSSRSSLQRVA